MQPDDMFVVSKLSGIIHKRTHDEKAYDSRHITLADLKAWLSARINLDHYTKAETSSASQVFAVINYLSSAIDANYEDLEDSKVPFSYFNHYASSVAATSSLLSTKIDYDTNWHLSSHRLTEEDVTVQLENRHVHLVKFDNGMVFSNFRLFKKSLAGTSREFALLLDNQSNIQNVEMRFTVPTDDVVPPSFVGASNALDVISAGTSCFIQFKEVDESQYFVQRSADLEVITPKKVNLFTFLSGCEDIDGKLIPDTPSTTRHGLKPYTKISILAPPSVNGYIFKAYYGAFANEIEKTEYHDGDEVVLTADFYLSAQYASDIVGYVRFYAPENETTGETELISAYEITNGIITKPIDPSTGLPYTSIEYPSLTSIEYDIKWNSDIPEITSVVGTYEIGSTWVKKQTIDIDVDDDDEGIMIDDGDEEQVIPDDKLSALIFVALEETDSEVGILASVNTTTFEDGMPATLVAVTIPDLDDGLEPS